MSKDTEILEATIRSIDKLLECCNKDYNSLIMRYAKSKEFTSESACRLTEARATLVGITDKYNQSKALLIVLTGDALVDVCNKVNNSAQSLMAERIMLQATGEELI